MIVNSFTPIRVLLLLLVLLPTTVRDFPDGGGGSTHDVNVLPVSKSTYDRVIVSFCIYHLSEYASRDIFAVCTLMILLQLFIKKDPREGCNSRLLCHT